MEEGRKSEYPEKSPDDEIQKMPHTKSQNSSPDRDSNPHWWHARKTDMLSYYATRRPTRHRQFSLYTVTQNHQADSCPFLHDNDV